MKTLVDISYFLWCIASGFLVGSFCKGQPITIIIALFIALISSNILLSYKLFNKE
jgi:hypothetical protein